MQLFAMSGMTTILLVSLWWLSCRGSVPTMASFPNNVSAEANSSTSIIVTWDAEPLVEVATIYQVLYQPLETFGGVIGPQVTNVSSGVNSVLLVDLQEYLNYNISVRSFTSMGGSAYSQPTVTTTFEDVPSGAPANVTAIPVSFNRVAVTWGAIPPIEQNGVITMYEVLYWPLHTQNGSREARVNASVLTLNLTLAFLGSYGISVRAYNGLGVGPYSESVTTDIPSQEFLPLLSLIPDPLKMLPVLPGTRHTLTCNITRDPVLSIATQLEVTWLNPDNQAIPSRDYNYSITEHMDSNTLSSMLEFNYMRTSQAGPYTCMVNMTGPQLVTDYSISTTLNITVKLTISSVDLVQSPSDVLYVGTRYEIACFVTLESANAVNTRVEARIQINPPDRISVGNISRINTTTLACNITFSALEQTDRLIHVVASIISMPRSPFILQSVGATSSLRLMRIQPLPSPVVTLLPASGLTVDIGEPLSLQCRACVVSNLWMQPVMEWLLPNGSNITRIPTILENGKPSSRTVYANTLNIDSIQVSDRGLYGCTVNVAIPEPPFIEHNMSMTSISVALAEPVVNLGIPSAPLWINTTESTELMCSVAPSNDTAVDLQEMTIYNITWQDMDRKLLHNNSRIMIKFPSNSSSVLSLLPLSVADYNLSCNVIATALHTGDYIIPSSPVTVNGSLRINIPSPTLNITSSPIEAHFYAGIRLNLTCYIHLALSSQSLDQHSTVNLFSVWSRSGIVLNDSQQVSIEEHVSLDDYLYKTSLVIQSLDAGRSHDGVYTCSVDIISSSSFVTGGSAITQKSIFLEALWFQFEIVDTHAGLNCAVWRQRETISKANDIKEEIIRNLNSRCECSLTVDLITDPGFLCSESDQTVVSFRAELHGSPIQQLRDSLEEWLNETTSSISVRAISYDIEDYCSVIVHSEADQPCSYPTGVTTTATAASEGPSYDFAIIVGGAAGVLTVLILAVACGVVICVIVCTKTKHASENLREADIQMSTLSCSNSNDYEDINKYRASGIYAEVGDKEYEAMFSAKIASMEDYSQYVPMASISGSLANLHRAAYSPTIAPPTYSAIPPIYSTATMNVSRDVDPPLYTQEVRGDSPVFNTVVIADAQGPTCSIDNPQNASSSADTVDKECDIVPANGDTFPATETSQGGDGATTCSAAPSGNKIESSIPSAVNPASDSPGTASQNAKTIAASSRAVISEDHMLASPLDM